MDIEDKKLLRDTAQMVNEMHTMVFGAEGQGGLFRALTETQRDIALHIKEDQEFQRAVEGRLHAERFNTLKLILAATGMGGLAGKLTSLFTDHTK